MTYAVMEQHVYYFGTAIKHILQLRRTILKAQNCFFKAKNNYFGAAKLLFFGHAKHTHTNG